MSELIHTVLLTMQDLRTRIDKWVFPPPEDSLENSQGLDPADECDCGQCRARADMYDLYAQLRAMRILHQ